MFQPLESGLNVDLAGFGFNVVSDLCKKHALTDNAVLPTLFFSNLAGIFLTVPVILGSKFLPQLMDSMGLYAAPLSPYEHCLLGLKSLIVGTSWVCAFFAMKHLPITIVSPIRASGPLWTLFGAIVLFQEMPSLLQGVGMALIFAGCFAFSVLGREEGIHFHRSKWVGFIVLATLVGMLLVLSDWVYFKAIAGPEALISILSVLRRCSVLVGFLVGAVIFKEVNKRKKAWVLLGIMVGVLLIILSER